LQWQGWLTVDYIHRFWGWSYQWTDSPIIFIYYLSYLFFIGLVIYFLSAFSRETTDMTKKGQALIIMYTAFIPLLLGTITDVVLPKLNVHMIPNVAPDFVIIWAVGLVYAIVRYRFLAITPATAADNILAAMGDPLFLIDVNLMIKYTNSATFGLLGYRIDDLQDKGIDIIFPQELKREQLAKITKSVGSYDLVLTTKNNANIPVIWSTSIIRGAVGEIIGTVCIAKDVTERKQMEQKLKESEEKYRILVENAGEIIIVVQNTRLKYVNKKVYDLIGYKPAELIDRSLSEYIYPEDIERFEEHNVKIEKGESFSGSFDFRMIHKSGRVLWFSLSAVTIEWQGKPAILNFVTDSTERKLGEEEKDKMFKMMIGREEWMIDLKNEVNALRKELGKEPKC
jgi:PAS domain S-box-containing protein